VAGEVPTHCATSRRVDVVVGLAPHAIAGAERARSGGVLADGAVLVAAVIALHGHVLRGQTIGPPELVFRLARIAAASEHEPEDQQKAPNHSLRNGALRRWLEASSAGQLPEIPLRAGKMRQKLG